MTNTTMTRRNLLIAASAAATAGAAAAAAIPPSYGADATILAAWERRHAAFKRWNALPAETAVPIGLSPEEAACQAIIDEAEEAIRSAVAKTPRGAELQLWLALYHSTSGGVDHDDAINRADLARLERNDSALDLHARAMLAAIRSLRAMGA